MRKGFYKQLSCEDKFGRKYYCCFKNHSRGWMKHKRGNRRIMRRRLERIDYDE